MEPEILTANQCKLLELASKDKLLTQQFFFTGGTALSYFYLKHRFSEDLDFFTTAEIDSKAVLGWVSHASKKAGAIRVEQQTLASQEIFYFHFGKASFVKVDFAYFPFDHLGEFKKHNLLRVSSLEDITVNKLQAVMTRKRARDYVDLYLGLKRLAWPISEARKNYQLKFEVQISMEQLATAFVNVLDAKDEPRFMGTTDFEEVKEYFLKLAKSLKKEFIV